MGFFKMFLDSIPDGVVGDWEDFFSSFESGEQARHWDALVGDNAISSDERIRRAIMCGSAREASEASRECLPWRP